MMFERFSPDARTVVVHTQEHARRLGHNHVGPEHLLLALVSLDQPASAALREHGVTPQGVEEEIVRLVGLGAGSHLFGTLDRDALASVGIDIDAVRARIEESFGPEALARADIAVHDGRRPSRRGPRRAAPTALARHWRRRRAARRPVVTAAAAAPTGLYRAAGARSGGHI
ncbi:Clp protease N-terminal domain-containing protein, partial [Streptomyces sp. NPDC056983]|uniref:Clp protease N-terminal domain-containing protein n=1 Tax=Streptomyces sp. NPDC056983 TaxID=3345987 RepID=UPI00363DE8ED